VIGAKPLLLSAVLIFTICVAKLRPARAALLLVDDARVFLALVAPVDGIELRPAPFASTYVGYGPIPQISSLSSRKALDRILVLTKLIEDSFSVRSVS
jgi:hypothetical protein